MSNFLFSDRAISYQRCDESTKYDIHLSFSAVSSRLTHRKRLIQRALDSRNPGEPFIYMRPKARLGLTKPDRRGKNVCFFIYKRF